MDPDKRAIGNAITIGFRDGTRSERVEVNYPIGHRRRRAEGIPLLLDKFRNNLATRFAAAQVERILGACSDQASLEAMPVSDFMELWIAST